jgi:outer membrane protein OmpA-like peptidoglycan-associated protein
MATNLLDALSSTIGTQLSSQASRLFGEPASGTQTAVGAILPALLGGVMKQGSTADGAAGLLRLLNSSSVDAGLVNNVGGVLAGGERTNALMTSGGDLLKGLFGDKVGNIASTISSMSGVKSSSAINLLSLAAPMVLAFIKNHVAQNGLNAGGLMNLLAGQAGFLQGKLDNRITQAAGLGDASGFLSSVSGAASKAAGAVAGVGAGAAHAAAGAAHAAAGAAQTVGRAAGDAAASAAESVRDAGSGTGKWLPWLIGIVVLVVLFLMFRSCGQPVENKAGEAAKAVANAAKSLSLPGGTTLTVPAGGFIESIYLYLSNPSGGAGSGYALDAVTFETGSATLAATSSAQLDQLAAVLTAFPTAAVSIEGHTDNTGDAAANKALSAQRAEAVKSALVGKGIAADRIAATGFGQEKPIASNDTEEGRAKNRRVEIVVTKR